jgi:hypothetical protein
MADPTLRQRLDGIGYGFLIPIFCVVSRPIASFQLVLLRLAEMLREITSMQLYCFHIAQLQAQGRWTGHMASLAKFHHARKGRRVCLAARDILGGNGLLLENHIARHLTDMEVVHPPTRAPTTSRRCSSAGRSPGSRPSAEPPGPPLALVHRHPRGHQPCPKQSSAHRCAPRRPFRRRLPRCHRGVAGRDRRRSGCR